MSPQPLEKQLTKNVDPRAIDEVWDRIEARRGRVWSSHLTGARISVAFAVVVALVALLVFRGFGAPPSTIRLANGDALPARLGQPVAREVQLDDGSRLSLAEGTRLEPTVNTGRALSFVMAQGATTFDVVPDGPRLWTIDAGLATVSVLGTRFRVTREPHRVRVDVERGLVRVESATLEGGEVKLTAGQWVEVRDDSPSTAASSVPPTTTALVSPPPSATAAPSSSTAVVQPTPPSTTSLVLAGTASATATESPWHPLAKKGEYGAAYEALGQEGVARETKRATTASELMQVADVARLSGHPKDAVAPLQRVVTEHHGDPSAPQAAFTLGKVQLDALGQPAAAAAAFEKAIALGLPMALREDAFARRVEAYSKAGNVAGAKTARAAYDDAFPDGRHRAAVAKLAP